MSRKIPSNVAASVQQRLLNKSTWYMGMLNRFSLDAAGTS